MDGTEHRQQTQTEPYVLGEEALQGRLPIEAIHHCRAAEQAGYDPDACAGGRWHAWMLLGEFERAWQESDAIARRGLAHPKPLWNGKPISGGRLLIRCLHGFGDSIQFIRYAKLLRPRVETIVVETHAELVQLFSAQPYLDRVITWADGSSKDFNQYDQQIEVMELPWALRTTLKDVPNEVPYLSVPQDTLNCSRRLLAIGESHPSVGLLWESSSWNPARSVPAAEFAKISQSTGLSFFSFQRGPGRQDLSLFRQHANIHDTAEHSTDILKTAADLASMDLLITVDTMAAHLAGALGKKAWTLLPHHADWRWMLDEHSSVWYPTMELLRQPVPGDWPSVVHEVCAKLASLPTV